MKLLYLCNGLKHTKPLQSADMWILTTIGYHHRHEGLGTWLYTASIQFKWYPYSSPFENEWLVCTALVLDTFMSSYINRSLV